MNKKDVCKLTRGTWIELLWEDTGPTVAMLLEKPKMQKGDISLYCFHYTGVGVPHVDSHAVHSQISHVLGVTNPTPLSPENSRYVRK